MEFLELINKEYEINGFLVLIKKLIEKIQKHPLLLNHKSIDLILDRLFTGIDRLSFVSVDGIFQLLTKTINLMPELAYLIIEPIRIRFFEEILSDATYFPNYSRLWGVLHSILKSSDRKDIGDFDELLEKAVFCILQPENIPCNIVFLSRETHEQSMRMEIKSSAILFLSRLLYFRTFQSVGYIITKCIEVFNDKDSPDIMIIASLCFMKSVIKNHISDDFDKETVFFNAIRLSKHENFQISKRAFNLELQALFLCTNMYTVLCEFGIFDSLVCFLFNDKASKAFRGVIYILENPQFDWIEMTKDILDQFIDSVFEVRQYSLIAYAILIFRSNNNSVDELLGDFSIVDQIISTIESINPIYIHHIIDCLIRVLNHCCERNSIISLFNVVDKEALRNLFEYADNDKIPTHVLDLFFNKTIADR